MSSTTQPVRLGPDYYATPLSAFKPLLSHLDPEGKFWEPACGDGRLIQAMLNAGLEANGDDLQHGYDFLKDTERYDVIVTNPPFSLAFEFVQHAIDHSWETFMLLRLNFLASQKRASWFRENEPNGLFVLTKRPSFAYGGTDSCDYAWFYWGDEKFGVVHL